jgi:hypothetical protein
MKILRITTVFIFLAFTSCNSPRIQEEPQKDTPKALEDKSSSLDIVSKRGSGDLVVSLYEELKDKSPELKDIETKIENLSKSEDDSTGLFDKYNGKNKSYYASAQSHVTQIGDSILREKMKGLIASSLTKYTSSISKQNDILKSIEKDNLTLADMHIVLKITRTLPLIEKYQHDNLPSTKSMEAFSKQLEQTIFYIDTLTKKQ